MNAQNPEWINYTSGNHITAFAEENNFLWSGTSGGLVKLDKTTGIPTFYLKLNSGLPDNFITSIAIDGNGIKWFGTHFGGLVKFDGISWIIYNVSNSGLTNNMVLFIAID